MQAGLNEVRRYFEATASLQHRLAEACGTAVVAAAEAIGVAMTAGNKVLLCGNGGSAADCQHVAGELVGQLSKDAARPGLAAIALTTDTSVLTAWSNDRGFDLVFARQVEALGRPGDVLMAISTSGHSRNVLIAVSAARARAMKTIGLTGEGGQLAGIVDVPIVIPERSTQHVQEAMLPIEHLICSLVERALFGAPGPVEQI